MTKVRGNIRLMNDDPAKNLFPLIVPVEYVESGVWKLPHSELNARDLILTWVILSEGQSMVYVTAEQVNDWKRREMDWEAIAFENMGRATGENPATHEMRDASGKLQWIAMMHADGLASSRVLMTRELSELFPQGYLLAIPERSVGMAIASDVAPFQRQSFMEVVRKCQSVGITKMLDRLLEPKDLLPARTSGF
jgi:hypothetical protein